MDDKDYKLINERLNSAIDSIIELKEKVVLLERLYGRVMDISLKVDSVEAILGRPTNPNFYILLIDINRKLEELEKIINYDG